MDDLLTDQDEPEKRIADLEHQLAGRKRAADLPPASPRVYVVDFVHGRVVKLAAGSSTQSVLPKTGKGSPSDDVAVDRAGNLYVVTSGGVMKLTPGSDNWTQLLGMPPFIDPMGLAVDARGSVYVADHTGSRAPGEGSLFGNWQASKDDAQGFVLKLPAG